MMEQAKGKFRLKGHESFILREGWLTKGLQAVSEDAKVFMENAGADALGVGTNMAKAIRYWIRESGLTKENQKKGTILTPLGELIFKNDPYFEDDFTLWIVHMNLVMNKEKVTSWYLFFNKVEAENFTKDELVELMRKQLLIYSGGEKFAERSLRDDCSAILNMYVKESVRELDPEDKRISPFSHLGLIKKEGEQYRKAQPNLSTVHSLLVYYLIQNYFEKENETGISIDALQKRDNLPGKILGLNRVSLNQYLDDLAAKNDIVVNRTAGLDMVYKNSNDTLDEIIQKYYEMINR